MSSATIWGIPYLSRVQLAFIELCGRYSGSGSEHKLFRSSRRGDYDDPRKANGMTSQPSPFERIARVVAIITVVALGISAGALITEGEVLVPYWQSLPPSDFLSWYHDNAGLLFNFFGPAEIVAAVLALTSALMFAVKRLQGSSWLIVAAAFAIAVLLAFPLYFKDVNASFAAGTIAVKDVAVELERWATWHWSRTVLALAAFVAAVLGVQPGSR